MKKFVTLLVIGFLLTTSFVSINAIAEKQQINTGPINKSIDEKVKVLLDFINKLDIKNPNLINSLKNVIITYYYDGEVLPGTFIFDPCDPINIEGLGIVNYDGTFGFLALEDGTAELDNTFNRNYISGEIAAICIFEDFEGEIIGDPEETSPLEITGQSGWFCLVEYSYLLELIVDESYSKGEPVQVTIKNIKESSEVEITESLFTVYRTVLLSSIKVYEESIQETWNIPIGGTETWCWDQKDQNGDQVSKGDYSIAGEFTINGRIHPIVMSFEIYKKSRNERNIQILFSQMLNNLPILQKIFNFLII